MPCRMFPSLINCCTIDWFTAWPDDALEKVAAKSLEDLDLDDETRAKCVRMCVYFHQSVGALSDRFQRELKRLNYVTPTSYLALITTFKSLLKRKREEILSLKTRYEMGLGKLEFASSQAGDKSNFNAPFCLFPFPCYIIKLCARVARRGLGEGAGGERMKMDDGGMDNLTPPKNEGSVSACV